MKIKYILLFFIVLSFHSIKSQTIKDFTSFGDTLTIKKEFNFKEKGITQKILFLGELTSENNITYKVYVSFLNFSGKGVNDLIFVSENNLCKYRLNMPTDAPVKISFNRLFFKKNKKIKFIKLVNNFNDWFCSPFECFEQIDNGSE